MSTSKGFSVRIFIPSGEPERLRIVEKSNWTGIGLVFPRSEYPEVRKRDELKRPGVYILWGPGESGQLPRTYIGEGEVLSQRLDQHAKQKDFWTRAVAFTSKDRNLNKASVQYLEARLIAIAREAKRAEIDNGNVPQLPVLSEADRADVEAFLEDLLLCLPVVGVMFFEKPKIDGRQTRLLFLKKKGIQARGFDSSEGFVVFAGSRAAKHEAPSCHSFLRDIRHTLMQQGVLVPDAEGYKMAQDYTFNSPSTAAGVLLGRAANGRTEWKDDQGRTLKEIQSFEADYHS